MRTGVLAGIVSLVVAIPVAVHVAAAAAATSTKAVVSDDESTLGSEDGLNRIGRTLLEVAAALIAAHLEIVYDSIALVAAGIAGMPLHLLLLRAFLNEETFFGQVRPIVVDSCRVQLAWRWQLRVALALLHADLVLHGLRGV